MKEPVKEKDVLESLIWKRFGFILLQFVSGIQWKQT